jgi:hypothetical protein
MLSTLGPAPYVLSCCAQIPVAMLCGSEVISGRAAPHLPDRTPHAHLTMPTSTLPGGEPPTGLAKPGRFGKVPCSPCVLGVKRSPLIGGKAMANAGEPTPWDVHPGQVNQYAIPNLLIGGTLSGLALTYQSDCTSEMLCTAYPNRRCWYSSVDWAREAVGGIGGLSIRTLRLREIGNLGTTEQRPWLFVRRGIRSGN